MCSKVYAIVVILLRVTYIWCVDEEKIECQNNDVSTTKYDYDRSYPLTADLKNDTRIYFLFGVKAERDAHIIFTETEKPAVKDDKAYEIVLGSERNQKIVIRRNRVGNSKKEFVENNVLNSKKWRYFWIRITYSNGIIEIGKMGNAEAFLSWKDETPLNVGYYGLSSWENNNVVNWKFPCTEMMKTGTTTTTSNTTTSTTTTPTTTTSTTTTSTTPISPEQTDEQKLIEHLFHENSTTMYPTNHSKLDKANITIRGQYSIKDDEFFEMNGSISISWNDEQLKWNLNSYNVSELNNVYYNVRRPFIFIKNNKTSDNMPKPLNFGSISVYSNGTVMWTAAPWYINIPCSPRGPSPYKPELRCILNFANFASNIKFNVDANRKEGTPYLFKKVVEKTTKEEYSAELFYTRSQNKTTA